MNKKRIIFSFLAIILLSMSTALAVPGIPHQFWGTVTYNGNSDISGLVVTAEIDGEEYGRGVTKDGEYGVTPNIFYVEDPEQTHSGDTITFYVNDIDTGVTYTFANGQHTELDFSAEGDDHEDTDGDGYINIGDNCPYIANPDQNNTDYDMFGDACDPDKDQDGYKCDPSDEDCYDDGQTEDFDCDDLDYDVNPGREEILCNLKNDDCDPSTPDEVDNDGDEHGCSDCDDSNSSITISDERACYTGPEGTEGVGPCVGGIQVCSVGSWGACIGEVTPEEEVANDGIDQDCDGSDYTESNDNGDDGGSSGSSGGGGGSSGGGGGGILPPFLQQEADEEDNQEDTGSNENTPTTPNTPEVETTSDDSENTEGTGSETDAPGSAVDESETNIVSRITGAVTGVVSDGQNAFIGVSIIVLVIVGAWFVSKKKKGKGSDSESEE